MNKILIISGFGWSGSGLLIDILSSTNKWKRFPLEFRLIKDKGGFLDLMNSSKDFSRPFNYSIELENFEKLCAVLGRSNGVKFGMNYDKLTNNQFSKEANFFINRLKIKYYYSDAFVFQYKNSLFLDLCWKISRKLKIRRRLKKRYIPLSIAEFKSEVFKFFDNLFIMNDEKQIILDQAVDAGDESTMYEFSDKFMMITVDRDPRDIFVDYVNSLDVLFDVDSFIELFKITRKSVTMDNKNILRLRFENLINNSEVELERVFEFLDISDIEIKDKIRMYNFSRSRSNIGIHKDFWDKSAIRKIELNLSEYCS